MLLFDIYNLNGQGLSPLQTFVRWSISPCTCCRMWQQKSCSLLSMDHEQFVCYQPMVPFLMLHYDNNHHQVERLHMRYWQHWPYDNIGRGSFEFSHLNMSSWIRMATKRLKTVIRYCMYIYIFCTSLSVEIKWIEWEPPIGHWYLEVETIKSFSSLIDMYKKWFIAIQYLVEFLYVLMVRCMLDIDK